jgi:hypothetical protein
MVGYNDLGDGGHTDGIAAQDAIHPIFCWRFECRSLYTYIHAVLNGNTFSVGNIIGELDEHRVIRLMHVWKTRTCG